MRGVTTSVNVAGEARCETCHGTGAAPGTSPVTCPTCHGRGALDDNQGLFSLSRVCPQCSGRGTIIEKPCKTCRGSGIVRRTREVKVRIPAGVDDGQRIRVKGRGAPGRANGPSGDLYVVVHVGTPSPLRPPRPQPHPDRAGDLRRGRPGVDGEGAHPRRARHPAHPAGHVVGPDLPREGPGRARARPQRRAGDLLVTVEVSVPKKLTDEQRAAVEEFARVSDEHPRAHLEVETDDAAKA